MGRPKDTCPWVATTKQIFLAPFNGWAIKASDATTTTINGATKTGAQTEIGSSDCYGFDMDAAGETATLQWLVPADLDVTSDVSFNVIWSPNDGTITQNWTWKVLYSVNTLESGVAMAAPATALDTVITLDAENDTAASLQKTPTGILVGGTLTAAQRDTGSLVSLYVEADVISATTLGSNLLGLLITYTVRNIEGA